MREHTNDSLTGKRRMKMGVIICEPSLTMNNLGKSSLFLEECKSILNMYVMDTKYISNNFQIDMLLGGTANKDDIFIFFNSENGEYTHEMLKLINKFYKAQSRIWPIAMEDTPACRKPPAPVSERQSFDVSSRNENRNLLNNNMRAIAHIFSRKIVAQTLSPLYQDEVLYFISHKRSDGEKITAKLADELRKLTRERNVYRDVVNVAVGENAQEDIDKNLAISDVLIFLQTKEANYSDWIIKELCYALVNDIPVLWIQIDGATEEELKIRPGEHPALSYKSEEFFNNVRLEEIANEIEECCFNLIMNSSNQVSSYIEYLHNLDSENKINLTQDSNHLWAYMVEYNEKTRDRYDDGKRKHYIQCFGRNPKQLDVKNLAERVESNGMNDINQKVFLLSNHGKREKITDKNMIIVENYDDYIMNLEHVSGKKIVHKNKRIIISGAFPECDEIYKASLMEAVLVYAREIIKNGYTLVFGAHPTFQKPIFEIGKLYSSDMKKSIEMHMDKKYLAEYNLEELQENCTLVLSESLQEMREKMICKSKNEMLICLGGKIKPDKSEQGVDIEVGLAKKAGIPVALVGTVGGRSAQFAHEKINEQNWKNLNPWEKSINEKLFYCVNHRVMVKKLLELIVT